MTTISNGLKPTNPFPFLETLGTPSTIPTIPYFKFKCGCKERELERRLPSWYSLYMIEPKTTAICLFWSLGWKFSPICLISLLFSHHDYPYKKATKESYYAIYSRNGAIIIYSLFSILFVLLIWPFAHPTFCAVGTWYVKLGSNWQLKTTQIDQQMISVGAFQLFSYHQIFVFAICFCLSGCTKKRSCLAQDSPHYSPAFVCTQDNQLVQHQSWN